MILVLLRRHSSGDNKLYKIEKSNQVDKFFKGKQQTTEDDDGDNTQKQKQMSRSE